MKTTKITELIKGFFKVNINIKIFSLLFAFVMWFMVVSSLNPSETKTYSVPLTVNGADELKENGIICLNQKEFEGQAVRIKIKASRPDLNSLDKNKDKLSAMVDLSRFDDFDDDSPAEAYVSVIPNLSVYSNAYEIVGYSPSGLSVRLDRLAEFSVPVRVVVSQGAMAGYIHSEPVAAVSAVTVKGPESMKNQVSYAALEIDLSDVSFDTVLTASPVLYDDNDKPIDSEYFEIKSGSIEVSVGVMKEGKITVEPPEYIGTAATGYSVVDVRLEPDVLEVVGKETDGEDSITLPSVSISGASETIEKTFNVEALLAEKGYEAASDKYKNVKVSIIIERQDPIAVTLGADDITIKGLDEGLELSSPLSGVSMELYGNKDIISAADIKAEIDLSGLSEGSHTVEVVPALPSGVSLAGRAYADVTLIPSKAEEETTKEPIEAEEEITQAEALEENPDLEE